MNWLEEGEGMAEVIERGMYCIGCREDRSRHWDPECPLLTCCIDEKHLEHCAECGEFVCEKLEEFAGQRSAHQEAVERLEQLAVS